MRFAVEFLGRIPASFSQNSISRLFVPGHNWLPVDHLLDPERATQYTKVVFEVFSEN